MLEKWNVGNRNIGMMKMERKYGIAEVVFTFHVSHFLNQSIFDR